MLHPSVAFWTLSILTASATATPLRKRQDTAPQLALYIQEVRTAIYALSIIEAGTASVVCGDSDASGVLEAQGYNVTYAETLICESAVGIEIFPNITQVAADLGTALTELEATQNSSAASVSLPCPDTDTSTLDDAGLDGEAIWNLICSSASQTATAVSASRIISATSANATITATFSSLATTSMPSNFASTTGMRANSTASSGTLEGASLSFGPSASLSKMSGNNSSTVPSSIGPTEVTVTVLQTIWVDDPPLSVTFGSSNSSANSTTTIHITSTRVVLTTVTEPPVGESTTIITATSGSAAQSQRSQNPRPTEPHGHPDMHHRPSSTRLPSWTGLQILPTGNTSLSLAYSSETGCR
ncbi:hypothetical protein LTR85_000565 [Meristemomyces frigidus]|nr:hypothetical protein LTR85_000565 [Meristemomyces frigidus]